MTALDLINQHAGKPLLTIIRNLSRSQLQNHRGERKWLNPTFARDLNMSILMSCAERKGCRLERHRQSYYVDIAATPH